MVRNLIFVTISLIAIVMAGPGDHDQKRPSGDHRRGPGRGHSFLPPVFRNISDEGKKEIGDLFKNQTLTISQIDTQLASLAKKYGVEAAYKEEQQKETVRHADIKKNATTVINSLPAIALKLSAIHENKDQTRKAQRVAMDALRKENRVAVDAIEFIHKRLGYLGGRHGGHKEGKGKLGGNHENKKGPRGGEKDQKKTKEEKSH